MGQSKSKSSPEKKNRKKKATLTVLTLGISGSGKSTFAKQMKILYCGGFTNEEKTNYRNIIVTNMLIGMQELVKQAEKLEHPVSETNLRRARYFKELNPVDAPWNQEVADKLIALWKDPAIQRTWERAPEYQLQMSMLDYHIDKIKDYLDESYVPTNEDLLRARQRTTGCITTTFEIDKYDWVLLDVGGQQPERAKWEPVLQEQNVTAIIFFAALDEFNMASSEQQGKTKMQVALETFSEVTTSESAMKSTVILFLNKSDLFEKKIKSKKGFESFKSTFPDYEGAQNLRETSDYVTNLFKEKMKKKKKGGEKEKKRREEDDSLFHTHVTCALDTDAMQTVFSAVRENMFMNSMALM